MFLADGDFTQAAQYAEKVLDVDPENARAYVGLLCAEMKLRKIEDLEYCDSSIGNISTYKNAVRFADQELRTELQIYEDKILKRLELKRQEKRKAEAEAISNLEQKLALLTNQGLEKIKRNFNIALALQLACYPIVIILSVIMLGANFYRFKLTLGYICFLLIPFIFASFTWFFKRKAQQQKKVDMLEYSAVMPFGSVAFCIWYNLWVTQILDWSGYYYSYIHQVIAIVLIPILILVMIIMGIRKIIKSKITIQRNQIIKEISRLKTGLLTE
jgi:tetratricopeptide (TPR) repeat protein